MSNPSDSRHAGSSVLFTNGDTSYEFFRDLGQAQYLQPPRIARVGAGLLAGAPPHARRLTRPPGARPPPTASAQQGPSPS